MLWIISSWILKGICKHFVFLICVPYWPWQYGKEGIQNIETRIWLKSQLEPPGKICYKKMEICMADLKFKPFLFLLIVVKNQNKKIWKQYDRSLVSRVSCYLVNQQYVEELRRTNFIFITKVCICQCTQKLIWVMVNSNIVSSWDQLHELTFFYCTMCCCNLYNSQDSCS